MTVVPLRFLPRPHTLQPIPDYSSVQTAEDVAELARYLEEAGASAIFPPGTVIADSAVELVSKLAATLGHELTGVAAE